MLPAELNARSCIWKHAGSDDELVAPQVSLALPCNGWHREAVDSRVKLNL